MRKRYQLLLTGLTAAMLFSLALSSASANELSVDERFILIAWDPLTFTAAGTDIECPVTLHGSFHEFTMDKVIGSLDGHTTQAIVNDSRCVGGRATILTADLPWHNQYNGFIGDLPDIFGVGIRLIGARFRVDPEGGLPACLAGTDATDPGLGIAEREEGGKITGLIADENATIDLGGSFLCEIGGSSRFSGTGDVRAGEDDDQILLWLI
jgi:hypothetical protein